MPLCSSNSKCSSTNTRLDSTVFAMWLTCIQLCYQLLLQPSVCPFNTLQVCYNTVILKMCMKKFNDDKLIFDKFDSFESFHKKMVNSAHFVKSIPCP